MVLLLKAIAIRCITPPVNGSKRGRMTLFPEMKVKGNKRDRIALLPWMKVKGSMMGRMPLLPGVEVTE